VLAELVNLGDKDGAASEEGAEASPASRAAAEPRAEASGEAPSEATVEAEGVAAAVAEPVAESPAVEEAKAAEAEEPKAAATAGGPTAAQVKELREKSGAGMMECKKALVACGNDMEKASEYLRKKGLASAEKKASRIAAEGRVGSYVHAGRMGVLIEINCETDFVSRGSQFKELVADMGMQVVACPDVSLGSRFWSACVWLRGRVLSCCCGGMQAVRVGTSVVAKEVETVSDEIAEPGGVCR
jgi:elongation factor Ts